MKDHITAPSSCYSLRLSLARNMGGPKSGERMLLYGRKTNQRMDINAIESRKQKII